MKYLLALILSVGIMTAQDNPLGPMKRLVVSGNGAVTLGQVVAGYSNNFHIGIRPPRRGNLVSVQEEIQSMNSLVYPNPSRDGIVNLKIENLQSFEVVNLLGNLVYDFRNISGGNGTRSFQLDTRGIYFIKMTSLTGINHSTILIFQ
jgi:hypothetical protein